MAERNAACSVYRVLLWQSPFGEIPGRFRWTEIPALAPIHRAAATYFTSTLLIHSKMMIIVDNFPLNNFSRAKGIIKKREIKLLWFTEYSCSNIGVQLLSGVHWFMTCNIIEINIIYIELSLRWILRVLRGHIKVFPLGEIFVTSRAWKKKGDSLSWSLPKKIIFSRQRIRKKEKVIISQKIRMTYFHEKHFAMCAALFHVTNNADRQAREAITSVSHCLSPPDVHFRSTHQFNWEDINFYPVLSVRVITWKYRLTHVSSDVAVLTAKRTYDTRPGLSNDQCRQSSDTNARWEIGKQNRITLSIHAVQKYPDGRSRRASSRCNVE